MKGRFLFFFLFVSATTVFGQKKSYLGYELGLGNSNIHSKYITEKTSSSKTGLSIGVKYQKPLAKTFRLNIGASLLFNGDEFNYFTVRTPNTSGDFERLSYRMGYLNVPITAQLHTKKKLLRFYATGGITTGLLLFNKASVAEHTPCFIYDETTLRRMELGVTGSVGMEIQYRLRGRVYFEVRGNAGLSDAVKSGPVPFYNRNVLFVFGHSTKLKK